MRQRSGTSSNGGSIPSPWPDRRARRKGEFIFYRDAKKINIPFCPLMASTSSLRETCIPFQVAEFGLFRPKRAGRIGARLKSLGFV
jgi:hypothetical protein